MDGLYSPVFWLVYVLGTAGTSVFMLSRPCPQPVVAIEVLLV
ncbi:hypothetical protein SAMN05421505_14733 [Sinosporangium album]|uniref:Uncharacterized protein n=1 Tax=Sinosporangium album TaxID=504805 RepID=A0A1G8K4Z7_9ACTN|nr:hypothetical protein SAMN05421505_14733 [Sinosporangium album]